MKNIKQLLCGIIMTMILCSSTIVSSPVSLSWEMMGYDSVMKSYKHRFVVKNISKTELGNNWKLFYSQFHKVIKQDSLQACEVINLKCNYFSIVPNARYRNIAIGDSMVVEYYAPGITQNSEAPESAFIVENNNNVPMKVALNTKALPLKNDGLSLFEENQLYMASNTAKQYNFIPAVKKINLSSGKFKLSDELNISYDPKFTNEYQFFKSKLSDGNRRMSKSKSAVKVKLSHLSASLSPEYYKIIVKNGVITIFAQDNHGMFNGIQTLLQLFRQTDRNSLLANMTIEDYPDLEYRGFMYDVARSFIAKKDLLRLIDIMATYKMNTFHLHFCDDEAWRIQIPGLDELTSVGAFHGYDESVALFPSYDGCFNPKDMSSSGNGFYTRQDFIEILKYAKERHIKVIPEVESPAHSRAAIYAMKARYNKYKDSDLLKATEFLLSDENDKSKYFSAQCYTDNVMNVALPSVYTFIDKVTVELKSMYKEADVELSEIHFGGDELPKGVWSESPIAQKFMGENGISNQQEMNEYFMSRLMKLMSNHNVKISGWNEMALNHKEDFNKMFQQHASSMYCWNTVPEWGDDYVPYHLANLGYSVVLCNVTNLYLDLAYRPHTEEIGLHWAGYVNEKSTFALQPYNIYNSARHTIGGEKIDLDKASQGKEKLTENGKKNIRGIQVQFFTEPFRNFDQSSYCFFPKSIGAAERAWNATPTWNDSVPGDFEKAFSSFYKLLVAEMPYWNSLKFNFHIPQPGLKIVDKMLYANSPIPAAEIRYTIDGSTPTVNSKLFTGKVPISDNVKEVCAKLFYLGKESVTSKITN